MPEPLAAGPKTGKIRIAGRNHPLVFQIRGPVRTLFSTSLDAASRDVHFFVPRARTVAMR